MFKKIMEAIDKFFNEVDMEMYENPETTAERIISMEMMRNTI